MTKDTNDTTYSPLPLVYSSAIASFEKDRDTVIGYDGYLNVEAMIKSPIFNTEDEYYIWAKGECEKWNTRNNSHNDLVDALKKIASDEFTYAEVLSIAEQSLEKAGVKI